MVLKIFTTKLIRPIRCFSNITITRSVYNLDQLFRPENYFEDLFESIPDYRKIEILMFLIKNDVGILHECGILKNDNNRLCLEL